MASIRVPLNLAYSLADRKAEHHIVIDDDNGDGSVSLSFDLDGFERDADDLQTVSREFSPDEATWASRWTVARIGGGTGYGPGVAQCSCGLDSPELPSTAARKRWHREHKAEIVRGEG